MTLAEKINAAITPGIPVGLCQCGCGRHTNIALSNNSKTGFKKGEPLRFLAGHIHNVLRRHNSDWGNQSQRRKKQEKVRAEIKDIAKRAPSFFTVHDMANAVRKHGFRVEGVSRMFKTANFWEDFKPLLRKRKVPPQYERKPIDNELETEISMLVNKYMCVCLDQPLEDGRSKYESCRNLSTNRTPLDDLMEKEEREEEDRIERFFRAKKRERLKISEDARFKTLRKSGWVPKKFRVAWGDPKKALTAA